MGIAILDREEERALLLRKDQAAVDRLGKAFQPLVHKIATRTARLFPGISKETLVAAGNEGLAIAIRKFDPKTYANGLGAYAQHWISIKMHEHVRASSMAGMHIPPSAQKLLPHLRKEWKKVHGDEAIDPHDTAQLEIISKNLGASLAIVVEAANLSRNRRVPASLPNGDCILDLIPGEHDTEAAVAGLEEEKLQRSLAQEALAALSARERTIVARRLMSDRAVPLRELAEEFGITAERVRQLETKALKTMRQAILDREPGFTPA